MRSLHCGFPSSIISMTSACPAIPVRRIAERAAIIHPWQRAEGFRPNHGPCLVARRVRSLCAGEFDAKASNVDDRMHGTRAHCIRVARQRANSNPRRSRTAGAIAKRHAAIATGRLSRLGALLSAGNRSPVRSIPLLVRSLLARTRAILLWRGSNGRPLGN